MVRRVCPAVRADAPFCVLRRLSSLLLAMILLVMLLPTAVFAADGAMTIYAGDTQITEGYWVTRDNGKTWTIENDPALRSRHIYYDGDKTLTLQNVNSFAAGITVQGDAVSLTIKLVGSNRLDYGIRVEAAQDASLTITGSGSLEATGSSHPAICVQSDSGDATLTIEEAEVEASANNDADGVYIQAGNGAKASLTVEGGSLTAEGDLDHSGIRFQFGADGTGTPSLTVDNNAIVRASGDAGGITSNAGSVTPTGTGGMVFDGGAVTAYGEATLREDLTLRNGETLDVPAGSELTIPAGRR